MRNHSSDQAPTHPTSNAEWAIDAMMPEIVALNQASWTALHESHATKGYNANVDYRIAYIVKRLVDSDIARRFMAIDFAHGTALKIYLVPACFYCHETNSLPCPPDLPHVFAHPSDAGFTIEYCNGPGVASSHLCGYGKEIPCLISLLRQMWDETGGELRSRDPCLLYTSPSPRDRQKSRMPSSA